MTTQPPGDKAKVLGERYEVGELIGRGGMADVREGHDMRLGRTVAIKRLRSDLASDPTFQARFRREAQSAASLNHPAIVAVYDTGEEVVADGTHVPYIVMELVEGRTLRDVLRDGRKILPERALEITAEVLAALDYSHRAGIVHRDIKPANVMLTPSGRVKVMDFGIARAIADASSNMTATAAVVGTAQYLSPEQARGEQVDARSDIYSTGCLLFELLCGRPPFQGDSPVSVAYQHVREDAPVPSDIEAEVSPEIDAIVGKALAKKTADRYQSAAEMRADIERALAGQAVDATATSALPAAAPVPTAPTSFLPEQEDDEVEEKKRSRAWIWVLLALLLLVALGVGAWALATGGGEETPQAAVSDVVDLPEQEAIDVLEADGFEVQTDNERSSEQDEGNVIDQSPDAEEVVDEGSTVTLLVGSGPNTVVIPNVVGLPRAEAEQILEQEKLTVNPDFLTEASDDPRGTVRASNPTADEEVARGTEVTLTVSEGPDDIEVPRVVGLTQEKAEAELAALNLQASPVFAESEQADPGTVIAQDPLAGTAADEGAIVQITVAEEPEEPTTETTTEPTTEPTETTTEPTETTTEPTETTTEPTETTTEPTETTTEPTETTTTEQTPTEPDPTGPPTDPGTPPTEDRAQRPGG